MDDIHSHGDEGVGWTSASSEWVPTCPECSRTVFRIVDALEHDLDLANARERELWAALGKARQDNLTLQRERGRRFDEVERLSNRIDELTQENVWLKRLIADAPTAYDRIASELALHRARAAGVEES